MCVLISIDVVFSIDKKGCELAEPREYMLTNKSHYSNRLKCIVPFFRRLQATWVRLSILLTET